MTFQTVQLADVAYSQAEQSLLMFADDQGLADGVTSLLDYVKAYEAVRTELLEEYPTLDGPLIGDLLGEAAASVWPSVVHQLT